jgi:hypothetical protein
MAARNRMRTGEPVAARRARRVALAIATSMVLLVGCSTGGGNRDQAPRPESMGTAVGAGSTPTPTLSVEVENVLATTRAGAVPPVATCPEGSTPDEPGPPDQARPPGEDWTPIAFDRRSGRIVLISVQQGGPVQTWTFDVCTNTWRQMDPQSVTTAPVSAWDIVYDADSDLTIVPGREGLVWAYDVETDSWTRAEAPSFDFPDPIYDPVSGLVVVRDEERMYAFDVETGAWTEVPQEEPLVLGRGGVVWAHDPTVDRIVLFHVGYGSGETTTWLYDPRTGRWARADVDTPMIEFPFGDLASGGEIAYDETAGRTVIASGSGRHSFDASVPRWESEPIGLHRSFGRLVYDAVNERLVLLPGNTWVHGRWTDQQDVLAWDAAAGEWIELVPPLGT